jgi:hypothetical protein
MLACRGPGPRAESAGSLPASVWAAGVLLAGRELSSATL